MEAQMNRGNVILSTMKFLVLLTIACSAYAQQPPQPAAQGQRGAARVTRPPLFFREEWKQIPTNAEHAVDQQSVANPDLELKLYGATGKEIQMSGATGNPENPQHLWTGLCTTPCAFALKHKTNFADLTGLGRIKWVTKTSGFHEVRPIVKLVDGTWLVADQAEKSPTDWLTKEVSFADVKWLKLDIDRAVTVGTIVASPNLSKVDEIGFVDLMPGSGHGQGGWSDVGIIEVYGKSVAREGAASK
jgi:hypothetical protein